FGAAFPKLIKLVQDKFRVDELYQVLIIRPIKAVAQLIYFIVDRIIIDKILVEGSAAVVGAVGSVSRSLQVGDGQRYMAVFAVGVAGLVYFSTRPATPDALRVTVNGMAVDVDAHRNSRAP